VGDADLAFTWLERGLAQAASFMGGVLVEPGFALLHADPRWGSLIGALGLAR